MSRRREAAELAKALRLSTQATIPLGSTFTSTSIPIPTISSHVLSNLPANEGEDKHKQYQDRDRDEAIGTTVRPLTPSTTPIERAGPDVPSSYLPGGHRTFDRVKMSGRPIGGAKDHESEEEDEEEDEDAVVADSEEELAGKHDDQADEEEDEDEEVPESEEEGGNGRKEGIIRAGAGAGAGAGASAANGGLDLRVLSDIPRHRARVEFDERAILPSIPSHSTIQTFTPSSNVPTPVSAPDPTVLKPIPTSASTSTSTPAAATASVHPNQYRNTVSTSTSTPPPVTIILPVPGSSTHHTFSSGLASASGSGPGSKAVGSAQSKPEAQAQDREQEESSPIKGFMGETRGSAVGSVVSASGSRSGGRSQGDSMAGVNVDVARGGSGPMTVLANEGRPKPRPRIRITSDARAMAMAGGANNTGVGTGVGGSNTSQERIRSIESGTVNVATYTATLDQSSRDGTGRPAIPSSPNTADLPPTAKSAPAGLSNVAGAIDMDEGEDEEVPSITLAKPQERNKVVATYGSRGKAKAGPSVEVTAPKKRQLLATQGGVNSESDEDDDFHPGEENKAGPSKARKVTTDGKTTRGRSMSNPAPLAEKTTTSKVNTAKPGARATRGRSRARDASPDPLDGIGDDSDDEFEDYPVAKKPAMAGKQTGRTTPGMRRGLTAKAGPVLMELEIEVPTTKRKVDVGDEPKRVSKKRRVASSSPSGSESGDGSRAVAQRKALGSLTSANEVIDIDDESRNAVAGPSSLTTSLTKDGSEHFDAAMRIEKDDFAPDAVPIDADDDEDDFVPDAPGKRKKAPAKGKSAPKKAPAAAKAKGGRKGAKATKSEAAAAIEAEGAIGEDNITGAGAHAEKKGKAPSAQADAFNKSAEHVQESDVEMEDRKAESQLPKEVSAVGSSRISTSQVRLKGKSVTKGKKATVESDADMEGDAESSRGSASPMKVAGENVPSGKKGNKRVAESDSEVESHASSAKENGVKGKGKAREDPAESESAVENAGRSQKAPRDNSPAILQPRATFKLNQSERPSSPSVVVDKFGNIKQFKTDRTDLPRVVSSTGGVKRMGMSRRNHIPSLHRNIQPPPKKLAAAPKKQEKQLKEGNYGSDEEPMDAFGRPIIGPDHPDYWKMED